MTLGINRLPAGGLVHRQRPLTFTLNGKRYGALEGDSLASALLANGVSVLGRSFKYHRPRGLMTAGSEEPNALLTVGDGAFAIPNQRATMVPVHDGQSARTQNAWPSVDLDFGVVNDLLSPALGAGFYYKTFMIGGPYVWRAFEFFIRRAAGLGAARQDRLPARFEKVNAHCDVLIVGAGPAGLAAALTAARAGVRVILVDEGLVMGATLAGDEQVGIGGHSAEAWRRAALAELQTYDQVRVLAKTTAFGLYDGQVAGLVQRLDPRNPHDVTERAWIVRSKKIILATGALERPLAFAGNDRPGVMLASALPTYARQFGVRVGRRPLIFTNNDSAYAAAHELRILTGADVALVDTRREVAPVVVAAVEAVGISPMLGFGLAKVHGRAGVTGLELVDLQSGRRHSMAADVVGMAGGWSPTIHLASHRGTKPQWSQTELAFLAGAPAPGADWRLAGAVQGRMGLAEALAAGADAAHGAVADLGKTAAADPLTVTGDDLGTARGQAAFWAMPARTLRRRKAFVDFQHDVTVKDVQQAAQEGFLSPEHMKRYTTLGMATDQGKLSNTLGQALLAQAQGKPMEEVGTTTYRPPFTPVMLGALIERNVAEQWMPERMTPIKAWHVANGAKLVEAGEWRRAWYTPRGIEDLTHASRREAFHVRQHVGLCDVSTLGKIDVQGPDAGVLLDLAYTGRMSTLRQGKSRYGLMLREDGVVLDDGTVSRLGPERFFVTTTTAEAPHVMTHLEHMVQVEFPQLDVHVTSVSDVWAAMALAGPKSREVLNALVGAETVSNARLPFMGFVEAQVAGVNVRIHRISFSGERAYELYAPARAGIAVWQAVLQAGAAHQIDTYGLEALDMLRIEKGYPTGNEIDGRTTAHMLGLEGMARDQKDFIGRVLRKRPAMVDPLVPTLVGLQTVVPDQPLRGGGQLVKEDQPQDRHDQLGHVSSAGYSTTLGRYIGLGFLRGGLAQWQDQTLYVADPVRGEHIQVRVGPPCHVDRDGELVRG